MPRSAIVEIESLEQYFPEGALLHGVHAVISAFVHRRPWAAALMALIFGPTIAMLYLGRGRLAIGYLAIPFMVAPLPFFAAHFDLLPISAETALVIVLVAVSIGGAFHAHRIASGNWFEGPRPIFARWYVVVVAIATLWYGLPFLVRGYLWEPFDIPSASMEPTLRVGDYFFVSRHAYLGSAKPVRGDVAVFTVPKLGGQAFVKRVVGLPGERIQMRDGVLVIEGFPAGLERLASPDSDDSKYPVRVYRETLPDGQSHLIQDRSDNAPYDHTPVYEVPPGHYFFLGDNRDNSQDSRNLDRFGFIPRENMVGPLAVVIWNSERQKLLFLEGD